MLAQRDSHEQGSDRLGHGKGYEARRLIRVVTIGLIDDVPVLHDEQGIRIRPLHKLLGSIGLAFECVAEVENVIRTGQLPHGTRAPHYACSEKLLHVMERQTVHIRVQHCASQLLDCRLYGGRWQGGIHRWRRIGPGRARQQQYECGKVREAILVHSEDPVEMHESRCLSRWPPAPAGAARF